MSHQSQVHYDVYVSSVAGHLYEVVQYINDPQCEELTVSLPAWIPGSYMIRDFAKNINWLRAKDDANNELKVERLDKQTWKIHNCGKSICIETQVYANDLSVRSAFINDQYAFFNGTSLFLQWQGYTGPCTVDLHVPPNNWSSWKIATAMQPASSSDDNVRFVCENYDELIDHPVLIGDLDISKFTVDGVDFMFVLTGEHFVDTDRICADLAKICKHHILLFGNRPPIDTYWFMTLLCQAGFGGLEHRASTVLQFARNELPSTQPISHMSDGYRTFLSLCSHEFFHTWHVKRSKPDVFVKMDLSQEIYTEQLWIYEGFTSYVDDLSLVRTNLIDKESYLELLGQLLTRLHRNAGKLKQTVTESSFYAWTRFYKQDASAANNIVSYYAKGAEIALCLDLLIRLKSQGDKSIFDVIWHLWDAFGKQKIGSNKDTIQQIVKHQLNINLDPFFEEALYSTVALPTQELLERHGVKVNLRPRCDASDKGGKASDSVASVDFGASFEDDKLGVRITQVLESTASYDAQLHVGDNLIAVDKWQVSKASLMSMLDNLADQQQINLHVLRDGRLLNLPMQVRPASKDTIYLTISDEQRVEDWLHKPTLTD